MVGIGVAHGRVLAHDVQALELPGQRRLHHLHHGQAGGGVQLGRGYAPGAGHQLTRGGLVHAVVVRVHHGDQAGVGRALHVVLATQRVQAGAGAADLAGHQRQRDEAARVVGAVHVLADAHAPQDHGGAAGGVQARHFADRGRVDAAHRCHGLGAESAHVVAQGFVALGAVGDEVGIDQPFLHDHVHQRVQQCHVGVRAELQHAVGVAREVRAARVHQDELGTLAHRVLDEAGRYRVVHHRVGADDDDDLGLRHILHWVADRARADALQQRRHAGGMAQPRAVVHVVAAEAQAHQLLEEVGLFVAAFGRAETGQGLGAVTVADAAQPAAGHVQRFLPGGLTEPGAGGGRVQRGAGVLGRIGAADQRHRQALRVARVVKAIAALDTQPPVVGRALAAFDEDDAVGGLDRRSGRDGGCHRTARLRGWRGIFRHVISQLAAHAAVRAHAVHLLRHGLQRDVPCGAQRAGGAGLHALAAGHAGGGA